LMYHRESGPGVLMNCAQCGTSISEEVPYCPSCGAKVLRASSSDKLIGRTILNQFIIQKKLGQGGFGAVYEATQPSLSRKVAIKTLHPHLAQQPALAARFRREGLAASKLSHPSIVKVYNFGETEDEIIWIAMEHLDGETLDARIRRAGTLSIKEFLELLLPLCDGLQEAHQKGIIHRDLKPENIMLVMDSGQWKVDNVGGKQSEASGITHSPLSTIHYSPRLLDFGVAALLDDIHVTQTGAVSGSPPYMPPEQWKGLKHTDHRSDQYSLGIIAYQCLSGRLPFDADTAPAWMQKHCLEAPIELSEFTQNLAVPSALQAVIMRALRKDPTQRFEDILAFKNALEAGAKGVFPEAAPNADTLPSFSTAPATIPEQRQSPKRLWLGVGLGALGMSLIFGMIVYFFLLPPTKNQASLLAATIPVEPPASKIVSKTPTLSTAPTSSPATSPAIKKSTPKLRGLTNKQVQGRVERMDFSGCVMFGIGAYSYDVQVFPEGRIASVDVTPNTNASLCVANTLRGLAFLPFDGPQTAHYIGVANVP
jgi:serine/threonine protein kinase